MAVIVDLVAKENPKMPQTGILPSLAYFGLSPSFHVYKTHFVVRVLCPGNSAEANITPVLLELAF